MNEVMLWANPVLLVVIAYLLDRKDKKQSEEIAELKSVHITNLDSLKKDHAASLAALKSEYAGDIASLKAEYAGDINKLYNLNLTNERQISDHKLKIAENHYTIPQLDHKFAHLDTTIKEGLNTLSVNFKESLNNLGTDIKGMTKALQDHLNSVHHNGQ